MTIHTIIYVFHFLCFSFFFPLLVFFFSQAHPDDIIKYKVSRNQTTKLESRTVGLRFRISQLHFQKGKLTVNFRCRVWLLAVLHDHISLSDQKIRSIMELRDIIRVYRFLFSPVRSSISFTMVHTCILSSSSPHDTKFPHYRKSQTL